MQKLLEIVAWFRFGVGDYAFYLLIISAACFGLERLFAWRKAQRAFRVGFFQDLGFLALNGHILGVLIWRGKDALWTSTGLAPFFWKVEAINVVAKAPVVVQFLVLLVLKDFIEYWVHRGLHRFGPLWEFHKVHHSILELDFLGNFRFHWMETFIYQAVTYLPLALMGFSHHAIMAMAIVTTVIGHLNHSNLPWSYGPLRYVFNNPRFHVWHHDQVVQGDHGKNFAIVFSCWDYLFGTADQRDGQPAALGFSGQEAFPTSLWGRMAWPLTRLLRPRPTPAPPPSPSVS